jgi:hypothetical protein
MRFVVINHLGRSEENGRYNFTLRQDWIETIAQGREFCVAEMSLTG